MGYLSPPQQRFAHTHGRLQVLTVSCLDARRGLVWVSKSKPRAVVGADTKTGDVDQRKIGIQQLTVLLLQ
jgi:hypothetical protein